MEHQDLFFSAANRQAVYRGFQRDFARDEKKSHSAIFIGVALLILALFQGPAEGWIFLIMGILALFVGLTFFIDNCNRNWAMHLIDWMGSPDRQDD